MSRVYLGIGSNLGDRQANIEQALEELKKQVDILHVSAFYETEPVGYADQPWFLNVVLAGETSLAPRELLTFTQGVEQALKRVKTIRWGPRSIDVDILLYEGITLDTPELTIPHPRMTQRNFVLVPLAEIAPDLTLEGRPIGELLAALDGEEIRKWN